MGISQAVAQSERRRFLQTVRERTGRHHATTITAMSVMSRQSQWFCELLSIISIVSIVSAVQLYALELYERQSTTGQDSARKDLHPWTASCLWGQKYCVNATANMCWLCLVCQVSICLIYEFQVLLGVLINAAAKQLIFTWNIREEEDLLKHCSSETTRPLPVSWLLWSTSCFLTQILQTLKTHSDNIMPPKRSVFTHNQKGACLNKKEDVGVVSDGGQNDELWQAPNRSCQSSTASRIRLSESISVAGRTPRTERPYSAVINHQPRRDTPPRGDRDHLPKRKDSKNKINILPATRWNILWGANEEVTRQF